MYWPGQCLEIFVLSGLGGCPRSLRGLKYSDLVADACQNLFRIQYSTSLNDVDMFDYKLFSVLMERVDTFHSLGPPPLCLSYY